MTDETMKHMGREIDVKELEALRKYVVAHEQGKSYLGVLVDAEIENADEPWGRYVLKDARTWSFTLRATDKGMLPGRAIYPVGLAPSAKEVWLNEPVIEPLAKWSDQDLAEVVLLIDQCEAAVEEVANIRKRAGRPELRIVSRMPEDLPPRPR